MCTNRQTTAASGRFHWKTETRRRHEGLLENIPVLFVHRGHVEGVDEGGLDGVEGETLDCTGGQVHLKALDLAVVGDVVAGHGVPQELHQQLVDEGGVRVGRNVHDHLAVVGVVGVEVVHGEDVFHGELGHVARAELHHVERGVALAVPLHALERPRLAHHAAHVVVEGLRQHQSVRQRDGEGMHVGHPVHVPGGHLLPDVRGLDSHQLDLALLKGCQADAADKGQVVSCAYLGQQVRRGQHVHEAD